MKKNLIVCESCTADYPKDYMKKVESSDELFCLECYDEYKKEVDNNESE